jgi:hypothetical protein
VSSPVAPTSWMERQSAGSSRATAPSSTAMILKETRVAGACDLPPCSWPKPVARTRRLFGTLQKPVLRPQTAAGTVRQFLVTKLEGGSSRMNRFFFCVNRFRGTFLCNKGIIFPKTAHHMA